MHAEQTLTIAERVQAGAALLDEKRPGWDQEIDLDTLALESECLCVLGQLFGKFAYGLDVLKLPRSYVAPGSEIVPYGFDLSRDMDRDLYPSLNDAWKALITARREAASHDQPARR